MFCGKCGTENQDGAKFCKGCGAELVRAAHPSLNEEGQASYQGQGGAYANYQTSELQGVMQQEQNIWQGQNVQQEQATWQGQSVQQGEGIPLGYEPIGMWGYFGYSLLFSLPVIGWIMQLIFAFGGTSNINLRNFARAQFCVVILWGILILILVMPILSYFMHYARW